MLEIIVGLALLTFLFWLGFHSTRALLLAVMWLFIKLSIVTFLGFVGLALCKTILLIPLGIKYFKFAFDVLA